MKLFISLIIILMSLACNQPDTKTTLLEKQIDSLKLKINDTYKPGLGEFMNSIQLHHSKLWFAGINANWKLADFEMHEIIETLDNIKKYQQARREIMDLGIINASLDSVNASISKQDVISFKSSFNLLTSNCNNCHRSVAFGFCAVKVPDVSNFSNQDFKVHVADDTTKRTSN